jgi:multiple sugar transport system ATP-binding protein
MATVVLENVTKVFDGGVVAVDDVTVDVADKEFMVIVGPSGCGKTTTLRMIAGLEQVTSGNVRIEDKIVNDVRPKDRDIAMVFQNYALYPHMTVYQNMAFSLKLRKYPKQTIRQKVAEVSDMLGLAGLLDRKPKALSGGQRQRVALGRAIVRNPKAFLFDEPLSNLDAKLRVTTRAELKALHHKLQTTSIYVTHDQAEAMTLGDRICVMYNGAVQQIAEPMAVYNRPINRFVAGFLGTPPMNFFDGNIEILADGAYFVTGRNKIRLPDRMRAKLSDYNSKAMILGVRGESFSLAPYEGQSNNLISAVVQVVQPLGDRMDVNLKTDDGFSFVANRGSHVRFEVGEVVKMYVDVEKVHLFEPGRTGKNITVS